MDHTQAITASAAACGAIGMWLMLPRGTAPGRMLGLLLGLVSLGLLASLLWPLGSWGDDALFWVLAGVTLVSAGATVTFRSPVYCAVWFALSLLGTAGLFLVQGAQFLAVATIVVYAGAILVTFLFVLMLAQSKGQAFYDRVCWEPLLSSATGAVLVGVLTMALVGSAFQNAPIKPIQELSQNILADDHVAHLGAELFSRYLIPVEVAGTLLLVALVGTVAIVSHQAPGARDRSLSREPKASAAPREKEPSHHG